MLSTATSRLLPWILQTASLSSIQYSSEHLLELLLLFTPPGRLVIGRSPDCSMATMNGSSPCCAWATSWLLPGPAWPEHIQHISPVNKAIGSIMRQFYHSVSLIWASQAQVLDNWSHDIKSSQVWIRVRCAAQGREVGRPPAGLFGLNTDKSPPKCHNSPLIVRLQPNLDSGQSKYCPPLSALLKWPHRPRHNTPKK